MGDGVAKCEHDKSGPVCPECAAPTSQREVRPPWAVRHRRLVQVVVLLVALAYVVWSSLRVTPLTAGPTSYPNVPYYAEFPSTRITRADVERYASGEIADGRLLKELRAQTLGTYELGAVFVPPKGAAVDYIRYGWPTWIVRYSYDAQYGDVYARTNPSTTRTPLRNGWWGWAYLVNRIDEQGRLETFLFSSQGLVGVPLALVAAWIGGRGLRWLVFLFRVAGRDGNRRRDRMVLRMPVICVVACAIGVTIASLWPQVRPSWAYPVPANPACADTGVTLTDLVRFGEESGGEAALAHAVLDATASAASSPESCLAFAWGTKTSITSTGWAVGRLLSGTVLEQQGAEASGRRIVSFEHENGSISVWVRWSGTERCVALYRFAYGKATTLLLELCAVWIGAGLCVWPIGYISRRRTKRRLGRGWCVVCGYDLGGL